MKVNMIQDDSINEVNVDIRYPKMKNFCYILGLVGAKKNADYINEQLEKRRERIEKNSNNLRGWENMIDYYNEIDDEKTLNYKH